MWLQRYAIFFISTNAIPAKPACHIFRRWLPFTLAMFAIPSNDASHSSAVAR